MPEKTMRMFLIFKEALEAEREAQKTYQQAAALCEDAALKKVLEGFYRDEVRHEKALLQRYNRLRKKYNVQGE
ncbi:MAG: ferritin-like domain-containing protein [Acidobacteriia bacterium]|nr:ferritin-like domain-containing protein [Terriglobia bacterium]